ncbi:MULTISPECIES: autotransporter-associated N-terminal domain-containing protein [Fusobacterium]|uniref:autotransporter-associated N-terminal domain-containing protein n=1 Tax=Fusobacterium TaxID=848 RepID=UPI00044C24FE|nr:MULTISPECIES: autotransporter-associated N-terminal domain-containing protein [Fusobacterium]EUB37844.1 autotransporter beta-domain protein [Fusobacterium sp. OBRC1]WRL73844.1 autotransporter-associated N-terminal domain-containing protein [Fusobacterium polymorphum]
MGNNNLYKVENTLRSIAKRYKSVKYSLGLAILFLMMGVSAFSEEVVAQEAVAQQEVMTNEQIASSKDNLKDSIGNLKSKIDTARTENEKGLAGLRLELIQLMEQGNQVVKSPWMSWQFGANYMYNKWNGTYKGKGDKAQKYPYEGVFERDTNEFNRYVAPNSSMYSLLAKTSNAKSASSNAREGLSNYGLASNVTQREPIVALELSAGISPRVVNKKSPDTSPAAPTVALPAFSPKLITPPVAPSAPVAPTIVLPSLNVNVRSAGNGSYAVVLGNASNSLIQEVAITGGDFKVSRNISGNPMWTYSFKNYTGRNAFHTGSTSQGFTGVPVVAANGTWTLNQITPTTGHSNISWQQNLGFLSVNIGAMLNNANSFLYTNANNGSANLQEFVHQDVHGGFATATIRTGIVNSVGATSPLVTAYDDMVAYNTTATQRSESGSVIPTSQHTFLNSGKIVIEGANTSLGNTYSHAGGSAIRQSTVNAGEIIFQPYFDGTTHFNKNSAVFVLSNDASLIHENVNYNSGKIKMYTMNAVGLVSDTEATRPVSFINRGEFQLYGQESAGIYIKRKANLDLQTVTKDFVFNTTTNKVTAGAFKPIEIFGDKSIGLYQSANTGTVEGNFAVNIGAAGKGNQTFSTAAVSNSTAGVSITDLNINPSDAKNTNIQGSFGILSNYGINLTSHQIKIFDKTEGNVGVYPNANVALNIGGGTIELNGGSGKTSKNNIGIYVNKQGAVKSTGDISVDGGVGNLAIFAIGGSLPTGVTNQVDVGEVKGTNTKNSVLVYGSDGAKINITKGMTVSGAGVESDASTTNKKDTGAAFATGTGTVITMNKATKETTPNIQITGTKLTDADRYVGFGLMAQNGGVINAKNNYIKVTNGSTAVASVGTNSNVDMTGGTVEYKGNGFALYAAGNGQINMTNAKLVLDGNAVGYEKVFGTPLPITTTGMTIHVKSNDVTIISLKNATAPLNLSTLSSTLNTWAGLSTTPTYDVGAANYKMAAIDGLSAYNIDQDLDRKAVANGTAGNNANTFVRNLAVQKAKVNLLSGKTVSATLNSTELRELGVSTVVGLDMNSSTTSTSRNDTQINLKSGSKIIADRVDNGNGAVGVFINYGEANIDNGATIDVEKSGINAANKAGVGVFSVNGSKIDNKGTINVGGENSIGILGLSYRKDDKGTLKRDEFGAKPNAGDVVVVNSGKINLDGQEAVGIYVENNDSNKSAVHTIEATNEANGVITMSGKKGIGMASKLGNLINKGKINITADQGTGMFVETDGTRTANLINEISGIISIGNSTSESVLRTGMFTKNQNVKIVNKGTINAGDNSYAIYGKDVELTPTSEINVGDNGVGIFTTSTTPATNNIDIQAGAKFNLGKNEAVGVFLGTDAATGVTASGVKVNDAGSIMNIGENSYGYVLKGRGTTFTNSNAGNVTLAPKAVYLYSDDTTGNITNNVALTSNGSVPGTATASATGGKNYGLYSAGTVVNNANIDFSKGVGNVAIYSIKGGTATNNSTITVGDSNPSATLYSLGMAAGYSTTDSGTAINNGTINVVGKDSIGMYASGTGSLVKNNAGHTINLSGDGSMGMYLDNGAKGVNDGTITTVGNPTGAVGVVVRNGAELTNNGTVNISSSGGYAKYVKGGVIKNYGTFTVSNGAVEEYTPGNKPTGKELEIDGVKVIDINAPAGVATATITANGKVQTPVVTNVSGTRNMLTSNIGMYIDTLRGTNPISGSLDVFGDTADLIIGAEASQVTTSKYIQVPQEIIAPYNSVMQANPLIKNWNIYSGALTWMSTATLDRSSGLIKNIYLAKMPYTAFAGNESTPVDSKDTYNFLDGLEQRYGVEGIGTRENQVFQKLNAIGKNESVLFYQATDEMMGHQYANVQQRINATGNILDKEFDYLRSEWQTASKDSNKIKTFGTRGDYKTDTAGIIDYKYNAYGVAYVHENEDIKLGRGIGWYAGIVHNRIKFKDIGGSKEDQLQGKVGLYKSVPFDDNNSLNWTISGDIFVGRNRMHRRFLVVDEVFHAKSRYYNYGISIKNEIGKEFRLSESFTLRPYAALDLEYGRISKIREKSGEVKLEVKQNDYISVKPEIGAELGFKHYFGAKTFRAGLGVAYENELGKVANGKNKARVANTTADWFNIRGEKEDRRGNVKFDLNLGLDNQRFGVTGNVGYDTKGQNVRGGLGLRVIF